MKKLSYEFIVEDRETERFGMNCYQLGVESLILLGSVAGLTPWLALPSG